MPEHSNPAVAGAGAEPGSAESAPGNKSMEAADVEEFLSDDEPSEQQRQCGSCHDFEAWVLDGGHDILAEMSRIADPKATTKHLEARGYARDCSARLFRKKTWGHGGSWWVSVGSSVKGI